MNDKGWDKLRRVTEKIISLYASILLDDHKSKIINCFLIFREILLSYKACKSIIPSAGWQRSVWFDGLNRGGNIIGDNFIKNRSEIRTAKDPN